MVRLLLFFKRIAPLLLFLAIEIVALSIFLSQNSYQRAKMVAVSNFFVGGLHTRFSSVTLYLSLKDANESLLAENNRLRSQLERMSVDTLIGKDMVALNFPYELPHEEYKIVKVVNNTYTRRDNYITIAGGSRQGIVPEMALFNSDGVVGYVKYCSENYSVAISLLNHRDFRTSGMVRGSNSPGSISWNGNNYRIVTMSEIPAHTNIAIGDTIVTTEFSNIFPTNLPIGTVSRVVDTNSVLMTVELETTADMSRLNYLYAISLRGQREREEAEAIVGEYEDN